MELSKEQQLLRTILNKAWEDEVFKSNLMTTPVEAIEALTGKRIKLPTGKSMVVTDQSDPSKVYINIPPQPDTADMELSEDQLDIIAGGGTPVPPVITDPSAPLNGLVD